MTRVTRADFSTCAGDCLEVPASWVEEASRLKLEYDEERDFHPQVDNDHSDHAHPHGNMIVQYTGYTVGTVVKQADTVLAGYPLMYPMAASTRAQVTMSTRVTCHSHVSRVRTSPRTRRPRTRAAPP